MTVSRQYQSSWSGKVEKGEEDLEVKYLVIMNKLAKVPYIFYLRKIYTFVWQRLAVYKQL